MRTHLRRPFVALGVLVVTVLSGGIAAAVTRGSDSQSAAGATNVLSTGGDRRAVVNSLSAPNGLLGDAPAAPTAPAPSTSVPVPTTEPSRPGATTPSTSPTTLAPPPSPPVGSLPPPPAPTTTVAPTTQWTVRPAPTPPSTVAPPPGPASATFSLSPTSGPSNTQIWARGTGCVADGRPTGIELYISDASGRPFNGDGGAAMPDGTWSLPTSFSGAPGVYSLLARCAVVNGPAVFDYPRATFTMTG